MTGLSARTEMLIQAPVARVFDCVVDPEKICRFWLKRVSAPLALNARIEWEFLVPGAKEYVAVKNFEANRRIAFSWSDGKNVDMRFDEHGPRTTHVTASVSGFEGRDAAAEAMNATEGFAIVLCDLKVFAETGEPGGMVRDRAALITESLRRK